MINAIGIISSNYRSDLLDSLSKIRPVGAIPFGGRYRLIDFALSNMVNAGIRTVGIIVPYRYRPISDHLGAGKDWGLDRRTGGMFVLPSAIPDLHFRIYKFCLKDFAANLEYMTNTDADYVVISSCNYIYNINYNDIIEKHKKEGANVTLVYKNLPSEDSATTSIIETDSESNVVDIIKPGQKSDSDEKHEMYKHFADIFVFNRLEFVRMVQACVDLEFTDLVDLIKANLQLLKVTTYEIEGYFEQIYSVSDYYRASMDMLNHSIRHELFMSKRRILTKVKDNPPTRYSGDIEVHNSLISSGCVIKGEITDSIIFRGCEIEEGAVIKNSIIMQNCKIGRDCIIENVIMDKAVEINNSVVLKGFKYRPMVIPKGSKL